MPVAGCTAFSFKTGDEVFLGKSFDWPSPYALIYVNKRGVQKTAMIAPLTKKKPAVWRSKYGSVTFNQAGQDIPTSGMNEAGLVVTGLLLRQTSYPRPDGRPVIGQGQWKQYLLDTYGSVRELLEDLNSVQILSPTGRFGLHYMICDRFGDCAVIQFVSGKRYCYTKDQLSHRVITNDSVYPSTLDEIKRYTTLGGKDPIPDGVEYQARFARASQMLAAFDEMESRSPMAYAFDILKKVEIAGYTKWQIIYDTKNRSVYFRTASKPAMKMIHMTSFDFSCRTPVQLLDVNNDLSGGVDGAFEDFSKEENRKLIRKVNNRALNMNDPVLRVMIRYPETIVCTE
jgi:penicillin V acylase-like amidase (Ntn superfamily)